MVRRESRAVTVECVVCGAWYVVRGMWCVVCGVWCVVCGEMTVRGSDECSSYEPARLPVDGYQLLCKMVHDFRSIIFGTIIIGFVVGIGSGLVLLRPSDRIGL
jgi:hypothetical protein